MRVLSLNKWIWNSYIILNIIFLLYLNVFFLLLIIYFKRDSPRDSTLLFFIAKFEIQSCLLYYSEIDETKPLETWAICQKDGRWNEVNFYCGRPGVAGGRPTPIAVPARCVKCRRNFHLSEEISFSFLMLCSICMQRSNQLSLLFRLTYRVAYKRKKMKKCFCFLYISWNRYYLKNQSNIGYFEEQIILTIYLNVRIIVVAIHNYLHWFRLR